MGKSNRRGGKAHLTPKPVPTPTNRSLPQLNTTTAIAADPTLGYKIRVLIYDFLNVAKDPDSARRINSTTDEHYLSVPYFNDAEGALIKAALVDAKIRSYEYDVLGYAQAESPDEDISWEEQTLDSAIRLMLSRFIDKRPASGDTRPCGPHHLAPLYASLFGIEMGEMHDGRFLGRLRRSGI